AALLPAGAGWIVVIATSNTALQLFLPGWVRARGLAAFQMVLFGSQAAGALLWGLIAGESGLVVTFVMAAVVLLAGTAAGQLRPLFDVRALDREPSLPWPEPSLGIEPAPELGP